MTRPVGGYKNAAGKKVPSVTTIINRFKDSGGLIHWACQCGVDGLDYRAVRDRAADAGTMAHVMIENWIKTGAMPGALVYAAEPEIADKYSKAENGLKNFIEWASNVKLEPVSTEISLVSERHQFGGTIDATLAKVNGKLSMGDWKTSNRLYLDYLVQVRAYGELWNENHPDDPIEGGYHLVRLSKENADFEHRYFAELDDAWEAFLLMRQLWDFVGKLKGRV